MGGGSKSKLGPMGLSGSQGITLKMDELVNKMLNKN